METSQNYEQISFTIILHSGNARSLAMEAISSGKNGEFIIAKQKMEEAERAFIEAHHAQTSLIQGEAGNNAKPPTVLLVHAQDHLMSSMVVKDLAYEMLDIYERLLKLE